MEPVSDVSLSIFDIVVLGIVGFGMVRGYKKGLVTTIIGVGGVFIALIMGVQFNYVFKDFFARNLNLAPQYIAVVSFAAVFLLVMIVFTFSFKMLENLLSQLKLGINQALGALFGGYLAALGLSILLILLRPINIPSERSVSDSITYGFMKTFAVDNLKLVGKALPLAKNVLYQLDQSVRDRIPQDSGGNSQPASPSGGQKPGPVR